MVELDIWCITINNFIKLVTLKVSSSVFVIFIRRKLNREIAFTRVLGKKVPIRLKLLRYNSRYQKLSNSFLRVLSALDRASIAHLIVESAQKIFNYKIEESDLFRLY